MIGAGIFKTANETRDLMWRAYPYKTIAKFIVHSIVVKCTIWQQTVYKDQSLI